MDAVLVLWKGLTLLKVLGFAAMVLGLVLFVLRFRVRRLQRAMGAGASPFDGLYRGAVGLTDELSWVAIRAQNGQLHRYIVVMLGGTLLWIPEEA
ncbi:MAG: hypothetical protein HC788_02565, partial [Sphingopyxis sp.]|nr:hypothetical protein [Sphingopyxis sp.]